MSKIGIDIVQIDRIKLEEKYVAQILHPDEYQFFEALTLVEAKKQFLAGRWAAKEAIFKVIDLNIAPKSISIGYKDNKPIVLTDNLNHIEISISHEKDYAVSVALNLVN